MGETEWLGCNEGSIIKQVEDVRECGEVFEKYRASVFSERD